MSLRDEKLGSQDALLTDKTTAIWGFAGCSGGVQTCIRELSVVVPSFCLYPDLTS